MRISLLLALPIVLLLGCYDVSEYSGNGDLTDNGVDSATDRYVLNLGEVDLRKTQKSVYQLSKLPEASFVVGIQITVPPRDRVLIENRAINPVILLKLSRADGEIVFVKKAKLDTWTWSTAVGKSKTFIYGRNDPGTYFQFLPHTEYTLTLQVLQSDGSQSEYTALLMAKSGGWK